MALPFTENFTDSDGVQLSSHNASWVLRSGGLEIQSNELANNGATGSTENCHYWSGDSFNSNHKASATYSNTSSRFFGVACRIQSGGSADYYAFYGRNAGSYGERKLVEVTGGVAADLAADSTRLFLNDIISLEVSGSSLTPKINGSTVLSGPITDSTLTGGAPGPASRGATTSFGRINDLVLDDLVAAPSGENSAKLLLVDGNMIFGIGQGGF
jgi:hypothetical protein